MVNIDRYRCKYDLIHDKKVKNNEPSSNNGWIYTAYYRKVHCSLDSFTRHTVLRGCFHYNVSLERPLRLPGLHEPPISRDELLGMYFLYPTIMKSISSIHGNEWFFSLQDKQEKFNLSHLIEAFKNRKDRNYFWKNNLTGVYRYAFRLWWWDRYAVNKFIRRKPTIAQTVWFHIYALWTKMFGTYGEKNLLWLVDDTKVNFQKEYFEKGHPLNP